MIFGIGFHKTATTSLEAALRCLGYRVHGGVPSNEVCSREQARQKAREICRSYDALQDMPWPILYKWLDKRYPKSKFILTIRPEKEWIQSVCRHFGNQYIRRHDWIYGKGDPIGNEGLYLKTYRQHNEDVLSYFGERRGEDLLVMDITNNDGWEKLCPFLDDPRPMIPFPQSNVSSERLKRASFSKKINILAKRVIFETTAGLRRGLKRLETWRMTQ
jgi:hypothetical protein